MPEIWPMDLVVALLSPPANLSLLSRAQRCFYYCSDSCLLRCFQHNGNQYLSAKWHHSQTFFFVSFGAWTRATPQYTLFLGAKLRHKVKMLGKYCSNERCSQQANVNSIHKYFLMCVRAEFICSSNVGFTVYNVFYLLKGQKMREREYALSWHHWCGINI